MKHSFPDSDTFTKFTGKGETGKHTFIYIYSRHAGSHAPIFRQATLVLFLLKTRLNCGVMCGCVCMHSIIGKGKVAQTDHTGA